MPLVSSIKDQSKVPKSILLGGQRSNVLSSIAEKCFDIWGILKMATVKSV